MIIGIDASKATEKAKTGIEKTVYELILNLKKLDNSNTYFLYTDKKLPKELLSSNFIEKYIPFPFLWHKKRLPLALLHDKPDLFIEMSSSLPFFSPRNSIVFIHDLASKHFPESYSFTQRILLNHTFSRGQKANTIVFPSQSTKNDYENYYKIKNKYSVIPLGFNKIAASSKKKFDFDYFLFVGRLELRKNIQNIIKSYSIFRENNGSGSKLVLAGSPGYGYKNILQEIDKFDTIKKDVILTGYIAENELPSLYENSISLLFPSLYEGFGLPILEAMSYKTPVITSDSSSMAEIAGNAALLVDPDNPDSIAKAMDSVYHDKTLRSDLISKGLKNIEKYSWLKSAEILLELIKEYENCNRT